MDKDEGGDYDDGDDDAAKDTDKFKTGLKMMQEEERRTGQFWFKVYRDYIK